MRYPVCSSRLMLFWQWAVSQSSRTSRRSRSTCDLSLSQRWHRIMVLVASMACNKGNSGERQWGRCLLVVLVWMGTMVEAAVVYGNGATSERNLPLCSGPREACNMIRQRFWFPSIITRLCKCPDLTDCEATWSDFQDKRTEAINARAQLKFCSLVGELESCQGKNKVAADISSNGMITIHCFCPERHFFRKLHSNETGQYFQCLPLGSCRKGDFCGHITSTSFETYHRCTCPSHHICVLQNRQLYNVSEFMYMGEAYKGVCVEY